MRIRTFNATPEHPAKVQPFIGSSLLPMHGIILGIELTTGRLVMFDPAKMKEAGIIHSPVIWLNAQKGKGKSATCKSFLCRFPAIQVGIDSEGKPLDAHWRAHGIKPEGGEESEYQAVADHFGALSFAIENAGINLFDPRMRMTYEDLVETVVNLVEMVSGQAPLPGFQVQAIQIAINKMYSTDRGRRAACPSFLRSLLLGLNERDVDAYEWDKIAQFYEENTGLCQEMGIRKEQPGNIPQDEFKRDASLAATYLGHLHGGDFGKLFGDENSLYDVLSHPALHIIWGGASNKARSIAEAMFLKWQKRALHSGNLELIPNVDVGDELHEAMTSRMYVRFLASWIKEIRAYPSYIIRATQYETDITKAGEAGSEIRAHAEGMMLGTGVRFVGLQPNSDELLGLYLRLGMSKQQVKLLTQLDTGCFAILIEGRPPIFYQHLLSPTEKRLVDTEGANRQMTNRRPVTMFGDIMRRASTNGVAHVGLEPDRARS